MTRRVHPRSCARAPCRARHCVTDSSHMTKRSAIDDGDSAEVVHVLAHTHWDREWYLPAGRFRQRLGALIDELLDHPAPSAPFLLDGQAVVLDDYAELRPDRVARLAAALRDGTLEAGPWYVLADELIPSGEALVRNLLAGRRTLHCFGAEPPRVLYSPDAFGHAAALPSMRAASEWTWSLRGADTAARVGRRATRCAGNRAMDRRSRCITCLRTATSSGRACPSMRRRPPNGGVQCTPRSRVALGPASCSSRMALITTLARLGTTTRFARSSPPPRLRPSSACRLRHSRPSCFVAHRARRFRPYAASCATPTDTRGRSRARSPRARGRSDATRRWSACSFETPSRGRRWRREEGAARDDT